MKLIKRFLTVFFAVVIIASAVMPAGAAGFSGTSDWAQGEVAEASSLGLIPDRLDGAEATRAITRAEFCALAVRLFKVMHEVAGQTDQNHYKMYFNPEYASALYDPFEDTDDEDVLIAYAIGIVLGTSDTTFEPNALVTREQICRMFYNILTVENISWRYTEQFTEAALCAYQDGYRVSDWARTSAAALLCSGVVKGVGNDTIDYAGNATVEQAVLLAVRFYNASLSNGFTNIADTETDKNGYIYPASYAYGSRYETLEEKYFRIYGVEGKTLYSSVS